MKGERLELVRGSGNVFRDLGRENADLEQVKALHSSSWLYAGFFGGTGSGALSFGSG